MSNIIEKDVRPEKGKGKDNEVIKLSKSQHDPYLADPNDFEVLDPSEGVNAEVPAHGQHGNSKAVASASPSKQAKTMPQKLDIFTSVLGEDVSGQRRLRPRSLREAAHALVGDNRNEWERWSDEFEQRLHAAMRSPHRTHGTPRL